MMVKFVYLRNNEKLFLPWLTMRQLNKGGTVSCQVYQNSLRVNKTGGVLDWSFGHPLLVFEFYLYHSLWTKIQFSNCCIRSKSSELSIYLFLLFSYSQVRSKLEALNFSLHTCSVCFLLPQIHYTFCKLNDLLLIPKGLKNLCDSMYTGSCTGRCRICLDFFIPHKGKHTCFGSISSLPLSFCLTVPWFPLLSSSCACRSL